MEVVDVLFRGNKFYTGLWLIRFHKETKALLRRMDKAHLREMLGKFSRELPVIWDSMTSEKHPVKKPGSLKKPKRR